MYFRANSQVNSYSSIISIFHNVHLVEEKFLEDLGVLTFPILQKTTKSFNIYLYFYRLFNYYNELHVLNYCYMYVNVQYIFIFIIKAMYNIFLLGIMSV